MLRRHWRALKSTGCVSLTTKPKKMGVNWYTAYRPPPGRGQCCPGSRNRPGGDGCSSPAYRCRSRRRNRTREMWESPPTGKTWGEQFSIAIAIDRSRQYNIFLWRLKDPLISWICHFFCQNACKWWNFYPTKKNEKCKISAKASQPQEKKPWLLALLEHCLSH